MSVRYKLIGREPVTEHGLETCHAFMLFDDLAHDRRCEWAVVIDSNGETVDWFNHSDLAYVLS